MDLLDALGKLRYGVSTADKEAMAVGRKLPGAPIDNSADQGAANRYASGYLFAQQWPTLAPMIQPLVDRIKTSRLPILGGETPEMQSYASQGVNRALLEAMRNRGPR